MSAGRMAPPGVPAAALYAVVRDPWALAATESAEWSMPVKVPGGNPTIAVPGDTPTSPLTLVGAAVVEVLVTVEPPRIPKLQAAPRGMALPGAQTAEVVKDHRTLAASPVPEALVAPVVMVAVYMVRGERAPEGVKVATLVEAT